MTRRRPTDPTAAKLTASATTTTPTPTAVAIAPIDPWLGQYLPDDRTPEQIVVDDEIQRAGHVALRIALPVSEDPPEDPPEDLPPPSPPPPRNGMSGSGSPATAAAEKKSLTTIVVKLARESSDLWRCDGEAYTSIDLGTHREHHRLDARAYRRWLMRTVYQRLDRSVSESTIRDACGTLAGIAMHDGDEHTAHVRIAGDGDTITVDLCDDRWRAIEVTADGWTVVESPDVRFLRRGAMRALPDPERGGELAELRDHVRITDATWPLVAGWLVGAIQPRGPYPVLVLRGPHGTGKSHTARVLRDLIDPSAAPIRSEPREPRDLVVAAQSSWVVALDNISHLPSWLSDGLCRLATGGGYAARALYTDAEEVVIDVQRPVILTGITDVVTAPDLLDRSLLVELEAIPDHDRETERDLIQRWHAARPRILGALYNAVSCSLRRRDEIRLPRLPRMADWAVAATAAEPALGLADGAVIAALNATRADAIEIALDASPIVAPLRSIAAAAANKVWTGTAAALLDALGKEVDADVTRRRTWPATPRALAGALARLGPMLREVGLVVGRLPRSHGGVRLWRVEGADRPSPSSPPSPSDEDRGDDTGDGDDGRPGPSPRPSPEIPSDYAAGDGGDGGDDRSRPLARGGQSAMWSAAVRRDARGLHDEVDE